MAPMNSKRKGGTDAPLTPKTSGPAPAATKAPTAARGRPRKNGKENRDPVSPLAAIGPVIPPLPVNDAPSSDPAQPSMAEENRLLRERLARAEGEQNQ
jgi:hypothetical protein